MECKDPQILDTSNGHPRLHRNSHGGAVEFSFFPISQLKKKKESTEAMHDKFVVGILITKSFLLDAS